MPAPSPINPTGPQKPRAPRKTPMMAVNPPKPVGGAMQDSIKPRVNPRMGPGMGRTGAGPSQMEQPGMSPPPPTPPTRPGASPYAPGATPDQTGTGQKAKPVGKGGKATLTQRLAKKVGKGQQESKAGEKMEKKAGKDNKREEMMEVGKGKKANPFTAKAKSMKGTKPAAFAAKMGAGKPKGFPSMDKRATKGLRGGNNKPPFPMGMGQKKAKK